MERTLARTSTVPTTRKAEDLSMSANRTDSRFWGGQDDAERKSTRVYNYLLGGAGAIFFSTFGATVLSKPKLLH